MKGRNWGGLRQKSKDIKRLHEEWARKNGYRENELLNATNTTRFINEKSKGTTTYDSQTISTEEVECEII
jgi:hypothetical protein